ncbi:PIN domain-containing protein [Mucilaginibacter sp.]|jgi:hypothetical protein|uniref:PIN domain-containing protein n=1 Tax=Mucilaginibacter sp. TaxID=1882438 RepID=UPI003563A3FC
MSSLSKTPISAEDFIQTVFTPDPKPIFFWDSCSLLDLLRLPYRKGTLSTLKSYIAIKVLMDSSTIYSVFSELSIREWNDHFQKTIDETNYSLNLTSDYHGHSIDMINHIFSTGLASEHIGNKGLVNEFESIADGILDNSIFLNTEKIANAALNRVAAKSPPSKKKPEFKDCAIWETVLDLAATIQPSGKKVVFFTVNTEDYVDKSRAPQLVIHSNIMSEAVTFGINVELTCEAAHLVII